MSQASLFNSIYYASENTDVAAAIDDGDFQNEEEHFDIFGANELRAPNEIFNPSYYLVQNSDVASAVAAGSFESLFEHYKIYGETENRVPSAVYEGFDADGYLNTNPDVGVALVMGEFTSALDHFITFGRNEDRKGAFPGGTEVYTLTTGPDNFVGTFQDDTFLADAQTLQSQDLLNGKGGNDKLSITLTGDILSLIHI